MVFAVCALLLHCSSLHFRRCQIFGSSWEPARLVSAFQPWSHSLHEDAAVCVEGEDSSPAASPSMSDEPQTRDSGGVQAPSSAGHLAPLNSNVPPDVMKTWVLRPSSWLPRKNKVDRSISAPVLTSATNPIVARVKVVRCGELTYGPCSARMESTSGLGSKFFKYRRTYWKSSYSR